jgi:hypothetical protein
MLLQAWIAATLFTQYGFGRQFGTSSARVIVEPDGHTGPDLGLPVAWRQSAPCHKSSNGINGGWRFSHAARFLQVPFFFRLEMTHWPDMRNVSGARQTEHWRLRGGAGGRAILASVGLGRIPGWQCWHSGRDGSSGDTIRVGTASGSSNRTES